MSTLQQASKLKMFEFPGFDPVIDMSVFEHLDCVDCKDELIAFPGFLDVHVHFREPGFLIRKQ